MTPDVERPRWIVGRYVVYDALAAGGMATVHLGRLLGPVGFSRTVAIKRLREQYATDPEFVPGFLDEARLAARIRHPNVVPTLDVVADDGQLLLVMEYVPGESLSRLLRAAVKNGARVPPRIAVGILVAALNGLHAAHEAKNEKGEPLGIVHRDVSPQNVLVGTDGVARVLDFGVAKASGRLTSTREGQLKGKVAYMAPEQLRSETVDRRTDVFAASIVLWETLTSRRLFVGESEAAVLTSVLLGPIAAPTTCAPDLPAAFDAIVLRGLDRDPAKRWPTAQQMANALEDALPPATPRQIAEWVDGLARDTLAARAARVAQIESSSTAEATEPGEVLAQLRATSSGSVAALAGSNPDLPTISQTGISLSSALPARRRPRRWILPASLAVAGVGSLALALAFATRPRPRPATAPRNASAPNAAVASAASAGSAASAVPSAEPPPVTSAPAEPAAATTARPVGPHHVAPTKKPKVDCSTPYTRDDLGRKIYKPECLE